MLEPTANDLQALVLYTGGDTLTGVQAPAIAVRAGAPGGYVPADNPGVAQGAYGGWQVNLAGYTNPGPNHLTAFLYFDNGNLANDYLYRHAVPGKPELNKMFTALDMGTQDINNAKVATAQQLRINGNNPGSAWNDTDLVIGDSSVNRHDSSLSIMSNASALKLTASGDTLNLRQWQGSDIANFNTNSVTASGLGSFGKLVMNDYDAVLRSNAAAGQHELIGTYNGWDQGAVYLAGYNVSNSATAVTNKVVVGGYNAPIPLYAAGGVVLPSVTLGNTCSTPDALGLSTGKSVAICTNGVWQMKGSTLLAGGVFYHAGASCPEGSLAADGSTFSSATYPDLYTALGSTTLPDLRGEFIRGWDNGRGVDSSRGLLTTQAGQIERHQHVGGYSDTHGGPFGTIWRNNMQGSGDSDYDNDGYLTNDGTDWYGTVNPAGVVGAETRPRNVALATCISTG